MRKKGTCPLFVLFRAAFFILRHLYNSPFRFCFFFLPSLINAYPGSLRLPLCRCVSLSPTPCERKQDFEVQTQPFFALSLSRRERVCFCSGDRVRGPSSSGGSAQTSCRGVLSFVCFPLLIHHTHQVTLFSFSPRFTPRERNAHTNETVPVRTSVVAAFGRTCTH